MLHPVPMQQARRDRARRARHVPSALCSRPPQPRWRRAAPYGRNQCRRSRRVATARDEHATCRPRCSRPPQLRWQRAAPCSCTKCRHSWRFACPNAHFCCQVETWLTEEFNLMRRLGPTRTVGRGTRPAAACGRSCVGAVTEAVRAMLPTGSTTGPEPAPRHTTPAAGAGGAAEPRSERRRRRRRHHHHHRCRRFRRCCLRRRHQGKSLSGRGYTELTGYASPIGQGMKE